MMYFLYVALLFVAIKSIQIILRKLNQPNKEKTIKAKKEIIELIKPIEKKLGLDIAPLYHLRVSGLFYKIEDNKEKDDLRSKMKVIAKDSGAKPLRNIYMFILLIFVQVGTVMSIYFVMATDPYKPLSIALLVLTIVFWLMIKRYIFAVLFFAFGLLVYFRLPSAVVFYLTLNMLYSVVTTIIKKTKNQKK